MLDFNELNQIKKNAFESIQRDCDNDIITDKKNKTIFYILLYVLPLIFSIFSWFNNVLISEFQKFVSTGIAIFTGLFFSLLLSISSKIRIEKENKNIDNSNFQMFKNNMKQIANITLYIILLGVLIFSLILINNITSFDNFIYVEKVITVLVIFLLIRYISSLLFLVQRLTSVIKDEINNII